MQSLPPDRLAAALLSAAIAGCVDAVGFGELGGYFVSFMSGNSTRLGVHFAYGEHGYALFILGLVTLFVGGAAAGTLIVERADTRGLGVVLLVQAVLLALASVLIGSARPMTGLVLLPVAMGMANTAIDDRRGGWVGLTYVTGALVRIGAGLAQLGRGARAYEVLLDILLWLSLVAGVVIGAAGRLHYGAEILLLPVVVLVAMGLSELAIARREGRRQAMASVPPTGRS